MKKKKISTLRQGIVMVMIMVACINIMLDFHYYAIYQEKIEMISYMLTEDSESNLDKAVTILKGKEILDQYGYLEVSNNTLGKEFIRECFVTALVSILCGIVVSMYLCLVHKNLYKNLNRFLYELEEKLAEFRENMKDFKPIDSEIEGIDKINEQLSGLRNYLHIIREQSFKEKEETKSLVTDISHQLKTPVAALDTCFSVLQNPNLSEEERKEFTNRCRSALDGLETLLQSLVQISRLEVGMIELDMKKAALEDTIITAINRIYPKASEKEMELIYEQEDFVDRIEVIQDKKWLCEAFINVFDNAVKYSPKKSQITIKLEKRTSFVRIEVCDEGIGIPKEIYHKIFQRFYRGTLEEMKNISGSGVGLYLTREIIEKHHGMISVSSKYEIKDRNYPGSTFLIQLPIAK